jgi:carboxylate-amine ligase
VIEAHFGESGPLSLGVEEELMILDARTFAPVGAVDTLIRGVEGLALPGLLKTELHASVVELNTRVCTTVDEAVEALAELRSAAAEIAARHGLVLAAAGAHPLVAPEDLPVVQERRYLEMIEVVGPAARRQGVNGLHVHVGTESAEACWHALRGVLPWLPLLLALSANSPYFAGVETGFASNRAQVLAELPRSGPPPPFESYAAWEAWVERLVRAGVMPDYTRIWWDVRPHPRFGTLEVRMPDQPTALTRTASFVALLQAIVRASLRDGPPGYDAAAFGDYLQNRWAAARYGTRAELVVPGGNGARPASKLLEELLELLEPAFAELGTRRHVNFGEPEGERQLEVGRAHGLRAVCADLAERSVAST